MYSIPWTRTDRLVVSRPHPIWRPRHRLAIPRDCAAQQTRAEGRPGHASAGRLQRSSFIRTAMMIDRSLRRSCAPRSTNKLSACAAACIGRCAFAAARSRTCDMRSACGLASPWPALRSRTDRRHQDCAHSLRQALNPRLRLGAPLGRSLVRPLAEWAGRRADFRCGCNGSGAHAEYLVSPCGT